VLRSAASDAGRYFEEVRPESAAVVMARPDGAAAIGGERKRRRWRATDT
jgi:hypothetical protein